MREKWELERKRDREREVGGEVGSKGETDTNATRRDISTDRESEREIGKERMRGERESGPNSFRWHCTNNGKGNGTVA